MATPTMLTLGPVHTMTASVVYSLPRKHVTVLCLTAVTFQISNDQTNWQTITFSNGQATFQAPFIRVTGGDAVASFV